jgi:hypothetical protein
VRSTTEGSLLRTMCAILVAVTAPGCSSGSHGQPIPLDSLSNVHLGMSAAQVRRARPRIFDNSGSLEEPLGNARAAFYVFGRDVGRQVAFADDELVGVALGETGPPSDSARLHRVHSEWARKWTALAGQPVRAQGFVERRGVKERVAVMIWQSAEQTFVLTYNPSTTGTQEVNAIVQSPKLSAGALLPAELREIVPVR